jgi:cephalosporin hydroxylase
MQEQNATLLINSAQEAIIDNLDVYKSYTKSPYLSIKHSTYFQVYAELFEQYRYKPITFVEVGILNGGSLFMWRDYFGPEARIIGIDLNPLAKKWEKEGFEIYIGSQSDNSFWKDFFNVVGPVDIVLDDGGHTFEQQIVTVDNCIPNIKDGGLAVVEDTHTSYFAHFGYPSKYSFIEWTKKLIDGINSRFPSVNVSNLPYKESVYSIAFFESIVCLRVDRKKCFISAPTSNNGISFDAVDYRNSMSNIEKINTARERFAFLKNVPVVNILGKKALAKYASYLEKKKLGKFF